MTKKIAIVSSFSDSCGNAYFTKVLIDSMRKNGADVECVELDLKLTQSVDGYFRKKADRHIDEICKTLEGYDGVNIQLEAGLFGTLPKDIIKRLYKLINANPHTSVTLHSPRLVSDSASQRKAIKSLLRFNFRGALREYLAHKSTDIHRALNRRLLDLLMNKNISLIVHTNRAKEQIKRIFGYENVHVHPLKIVASGFCPDNSVIDRVKNILNFGDDEKIIGMFGFINEYKGHTLALEAIANLPPEYKLLIFGRQHPQTIKDNEPVSPYLRTLQKLISDDKRIRRNRVFFMGEYSTEDFINLAATVDVVWLPYVENGQDGSGIASICLDVSPKVLCSASFAFDELFKLINYRNYYRFDIGNALELASKTRMVLVDSSLHITECGEYTLDSQAKMYINLATN